MEVQLPQQSVQINLNNKIITLHNVTIVKNPRIVKVDAAQYSNLLKGVAVGAPIKLLNGAPNALKLPMPSLVPMKSFQTAPALVKSTPIFRQASAPSVIHVNQTPVIKQASNFVSNHQLIRTFQPTQPVTTNGGTIQVVKPMLFASQQSPALVSSPVKMQTIPVKPTVIISPQKANTNEMTPKKILPADHQQQHHVKFQLQPQSPPPLQSLSSSPPQIVSNQTSVITKPTLSPPVATAASLPIIAPVLPIKTKVIVSPPLKTKCIEEPQLQEAKKPCNKLEFRCMFCKEVFFDEPQHLLEHMNTSHSEKLAEKPTDQKKTVVEEVDEVNTHVLKNEPPKQGSLSSASPSASSSSSSSDDEDEEMTQDDDEEEVNDLIMDLEEDDNSDMGEDEEESNDGSQDRTNTSTPESPEFEEHVPSQNDSVVSAVEAGEQYDEDDYDIDGNCTCTRMDNSER
jgi:hypothetical protein